MNIIILKGLPASGKTSWANEYLDADKTYKRVNKDSLRAMMDNGRWGRKNERFVLKIRDIIIEESLKDGWNIIVDDTNLNPAHERDIRALAQKHGATVEIQDFSDTPLEECIKRDIGRPGAVGEKVIRDMWNKYLRPKPEMTIPNPYLPDAIICDLDGCLCLFGEKSPYDRDFLQDTPNQAVLNVLNHYRENTPIIFTSGRNDKFRDQTVMWLENLSLPTGLLFMRADGDARKDVVVKQEMYEGIIKDVYNILFALDDRDQVVQLWRSLGLTCFQVAEGNF